MRFAERLVTDTSSVFVALICDASSTTRYGAPMSVARSRPFRRTRALSATRPRSSCQPIRPLPAARTSSCTRPCRRTPPHRWPNVVHDTSRSTFWLRRQPWAPLEKAHGPRAGNVDGLTSGAIRVERLAAPVPVTRRRSTSRRRVSADRPRACPLAARGRRPRRPLIGSNATIVVRRTSSGTHPSTARSLVLLTK